MTLGVTRLRNQPVLLTGGAGFVGSNIAGLLARMGARVTVLDNLFTGLRSLVPRHPHVTFIEGDVCDERLVDRLLSKARYVIHAAAKNIIISTRNTYDDYETNIGGTLKMLLAARRHGIRRFVYTSSSSVYGNSSELPIAEDSSLYTLSPYSVSKLAGENYCTAFYESYGLPCVMLRYSNVYGVNQDPRNPYCGVVSRFFESALARRPLELHGDGEQTRDFTYVDDTASATVAALLSARAEGQVLNVGTGTETSVNTLARKVLEVTGTTVPIVYKDRRDIDNIRRRVLSIERIRRVL